MKPLVRKISRITLLILGSLIALVVLLIATPIGTKAILNLADSSLDALSIEHESGSLAGELKLKRVSWKAESIDVSVSDFLLNLNWRCFFKGDVCIEEVSSSAIKAKVFNSEEPAPEPSSEPGLITLPLSVSVNQLSFDLIDVEVEDTLSLKLQQLKTALSMHEVLAVEHFSWGQLTLDLPQAESETPPATTQPSLFNPEDIANWQYTPPTLKPLVFPIVGEINNLNLGPIHVTQANNKLVDIDAVSAHVAINEDELDVKTFNLSHELGKLALTAKVCNII